MKQVPVTLSFDAESHVGYLNLSIEALARAGLTERDLIGRVMSPAYRREEDGSVKIVEFAFVPLDQVKVEMIEENVEFERLGPSDRLNNIDEP